MTLYGAKVSQDYVQRSNKKRKPRYPDSITYPKDRRPVWNEYQIQEYEAGIWTTIYTVQGRYVAVDEVYNLIARNGSKYRYVSPTGYIYDGYTFVLKG